MTIEVEFYFDFGSPNAYLSHLLIPGIEARTGIAFRYRPVLLGGVFKLTNNASPMVAFRDVKNKLEYFQLETERFLRRHDITRFRRNPHFPVNTLALMRGAVYAQSAGLFDDYAEAAFYHMWVAPKKLDDPDVLRRALQESGLPAADIMAGMAQSDVKQDLIAQTSNAVERGIFGAPSFFVDDALYFGKEKLSDVEAEIQRRLQSTGP